MPSSRYKRTRLSMSEPPPRLPDVEISYSTPPFVPDLSPMGIVLSLNEVMSEVFRFLGNKDVLSCLLVSKKFQNVAFPHLYRHMDLAPLKRRYTNPDDKPEIPERHTKRYTNSLELYPHEQSYFLNHNTYPSSKSWICTAPAIGPIHVRMLFVNNRGKPTHTDNHGNSSASGCYRCPKCQDNKITADFCVVRAPNLAFIDPFTYPFAVPQNTEATDTVVLLRHMVPTSGWKDCHRSNAHHNWSSHPSPLAEPPKTLTFVILPQYWDHGFVLNNQHQPKFSEPITIKQNLSYLIYLMAERTAVQVDHHITIVGLEDCNPFARPDYWMRNDERETRWPPILRDQFKSRMSTWSSDDQKVRMSTVRTVSFEEYLNSNEWSPEALSPILVARWLKLLENRRLLDAARGQKKLPFAKESGMWYALKRSEDHTIKSAERERVKREKVEAEKEKRKESYELKKLVEVKKEPDAEKEAEGEKEKDKEKDQGRVRTRSMRKRLSELASGKGTTRDAE